MQIAENVGGDLDPGEDRVQGPLAGLEGATGAEWSLFCPGMGIALDSWALLSELLDRPAAGAGWVPVAGVNTEAAAGTDVSGPPAVVGAVVS